MLAVAVMLPCHAGPWVLVLIAVIVSCWHQQSTLEQWIAGLGAGLFLIVVGYLVLVFIIVVWLSVVMVFHGPLL